MRMITKDYIVYNGTKIFEGSIVTTSTYPDTKWILHEGWYQIDTVNYLGWYLSSIPANQVIPVTLDLLGTFTIISGGYPQPTWEKVESIICVYGSTQLSEVAVWFETAPISVVVDNMRLTAVALNMESEVMIFTACHDECTYQVSLGADGWSELRVIEPLPAYNGELRPIYNGEIR